MTKEVNSGNIPIDKICKRGENVENVSFESYIRKKGVSLHKLSDVCGIDFSVMRGRMKGDSEFTVGEIEAIAEYLLMNEAEIMLYFFKR